MGFCNPCVCTNVSVSGKGAGSISSAAASRKLEQSTALRSAEQLSKGGNDLRKKKRSNKSSVQNRSCVLHPVENFPSSLPCQYPAGWAHRGEPRCELHPAEMGLGSARGASSRPHRLSPFQLSFCTARGRFGSCSSSTGHWRRCPCSCRAKCPHQHSHGTQLPAASLVASRPRGKEAAPQAAGFVSYLFSKTNRGTVANARTKLERFIKLPLLIKKGAESRAGAALWDLVKWWFVGRGVGGDLRSKTPQTKLLENYLKIEQIFLRLANWR